MTGNSVEAVLARGDFMLRQWGVPGIVARTDPANLAQTAKTRATPAAQAAKQLVVPGANATVVTGRDPLEITGDNDE